MVWKADEEEGFLELAPFLDEAALEELGSADPGLMLVEAAILRVVGAMAVSEVRIAVIDFAGQSF